MREPDSIFRHRIDVWRFVVISSVATKTFPADIVGHDEDDVRFFCRDFFIADTSTERCASKEADCQNCA